MNSNWPRRWIVVLRAYETGTGALPGHGTGFFEHKKQDAGIDPPSSGSK